MFDCADLVPVYDPEGRLLFHVEPDWAERCGNLDLIRSRKGHVRRAYVRADAPTPWLERLLVAGKGSRLGWCVWQHLDDGHRVRTLKGIRGSR